MTVIRTDLIVADRGGLIPAGMGDMACPADDIPQINENQEALLEPYAWMDGLTLGILKNEIVPKIAEIKSKGVIAAASDDTWVEFLFKDLEKELGFIRNPENNSKIIIATAVARASSEKARELFLTTEISGRTLPTTHLNDQLPNLIKSLKLLNLCVDRVFTQDPYRENIKIQKFCRDFNEVTHLARVRIIQAQEDLDRKASDQLTAAVSGVLFK